MFLSLFVRLQFVYYVIQLLAARARDFLTIQIDNRLFQLRADITFCAFRVNYNLNGIISKQDIMVLVATVLE